MLRLLLAMWLAAPSTSTLPATSRASSDLVDLTQIDHHIQLDIRYATADNFTHQVVYPEARCLLRRAVAERLAAVAAELGRAGFGLRVFDCYRPRSAQRKFWRLVPDPRYVADPAKGSRHNRGAAVDLTLLAADGQPLPMGSAFDEFSEKAHRDYRGLSTAERANRQTLEDAMARHGFVGMPTEWWHFDDTGWRNYPLGDEEWPAPSPPPAGRH